MKKTVSIVTGLALMVTTALPSQAANLRVSWWGGDARHAATQEALQVCGDKHGHTISPEFTGFDGHLERLTTQLAGGTEPDLMQVNWPWLPLFSRDGTGLADLNEFSDVLDLSQWDEATLETGMRNGALNGLPVSITGRVLFINADTFAEAGVDAPESWDDMIAAAETFKAKLGDNYYPYDGARYNAMLLTALYASQKTGVGFIDPETAEVAWDEDTLAEAIEFYQELVDAGVMKDWRSIAAMGNPGLQERSDWAGGEVASSYEWDTTVSQIQGPWGEELPACAGDGTAHRRCGVGRDFPQTLNDVCHLRPLAKSGSGSANPQLFDGRGRGRAHHGDPARYPGGTVGDGASGSGRLDRPQRQGRQRSGAGCRRTGGFALL